MDNTTQHNPRAGRITQARIASPWCPQPAGPHHYEEMEMDTTQKSDLSAGIIARNFPIACGQLQMGDTTLVTYYGLLYRLRRVEPGQYGVIATLEA